MKLPLPTFQQLFAKLLNLAAFVGFLFLPQWARSDNSDVREKLTNVEMPIQIENAVLREIPVAERADVEKKICETFGESLVVGRGPWGFGYLSELPNCVAVEKANALSGGAVWTLQVTSVAPREISVQVCRDSKLAKSGDELCMAAVKFPAEKNIARMLGEPYFVRTIVAALMDQMPFLSKAVEKLLQKKPDGQSYFMPRVEPDLKPGVRIPRFDARLIPVEVNLVPNSVLFNVKTVQRSSAVTNAGSSQFWLINSRGRNQREAEFKKSLTAVYREVSRIVKDLEIKKHDVTKIVGRDVRGDVKRTLSFSRRIEGEMSVRAGYFSGFGAVQPENSLGGSADAALYLSPWLNFWVDGSYTKSEYLAKAKVDSGEISNVSKAEKSLFTNVRIGGGVGFRYTFSHDLTFFVYPRVSDMTLGWKFSSPGNIDAPGFHNDVNIHLKSLLGAGAGFRSPESWPVNMQITLGYDGMGASNYKGMSADIELMYELPSKVAALTSLWLFDRAWISLYGRVQQHSFTVGSGVASEWTLSVSEAIGGLGYRLEFL